MGFFPSFRPLDISVPTGVDSSCGILLGNKKEQTIDTHASVGWISTVLCYREVLGGGVTKLLRILWWWLDKSIHAIGCLVKGPQDVSVQFLQLLFRTKKFFLR